MKKFLKSKKRKNFFIYFITGIYILFFGVPLQYASYQEIFISGESASNGIYDPSVEYDNLGVGYLSYSAIDAPEYIHTHIAKSIDNGQNWTYLTTINLSVTDVVDSTNGAWRHEVSTLIYDPDDVGKEWKIYWHKYFCKSPYGSSDRRFQYGWIAYKYASSPAGPWSSEEALFGGIFPVAPFTTSFTLNNLSPDLANVVTYTEPGAFIKDGIIYISLVAIHLPATGFSDYNVVLVASSNHGDSWYYINTLTDVTDANSLGYDLLTAPSIAEENNRIFLFEAVRKSPDMRTGTYIFEFEDIKTGKLKRDSNGNLVPVKFLPPSISGFINAGECSYDEKNINGGILMAQVANLSNYPDVTYKIYNTYERVFNITNNSNTTTITSTINSNVDNIKLAPNPCNIRYDSSITFYKLPANVTIEIYTLSRELVWSKRIDNSTDSLEWNLKNLDGIEISSGIYIYKIADDRGNIKREKFVIIK